MVDLSPEAGVAVGVIVGLISTCVQSVGLTLQRKSHMLEDSKEDHLPRRAPYRRRRWQIGMLLFLIANIVGSTIQITTLPLPLLSTLQASGLVFNSILASLLLKEPWTWRTGIGTTLVVAGAFLISWFSALPEPSHNLHQLLDLLWKWGFLVWFILSLVFTGAVLAVTFFLQYCVSAHRRRSARAGLVRGMGYGMISGILSAHALLLAKSAVELIVRSIKDKNNQFRTYQSWLLLIAFLFLSLTQLYYLHRGLKLVSTSILYPFVFCVYNIVAILDGLIYFRQTDRLPPLHAGIIALGTVILLAGVLALSWFQEAEECDAVGPDGEPHQHMVKSEIPQTVLVPGMGFVGDPEDDITNESAIASDDEYGSADVSSSDVEGGDASESSALLGDHDGRRRSSMMTRRKSVASEHPTRRRKRASTLKEMRDIWAQLSDSENDGSLPRYGTFHFGGHDPQHHSRSASARRPQDAGGLQQTVQRTRRKSAGHDPNTPTSAFLSAAPQPPADLDGETAMEDSTETLQRSSTMPAPKDHQGRRRRRSSATAARPRHSSGGALFSELLRMEWWRARQRGPKTHGEEAGEQVTRRPDSSRSRAGVGRVHFVGEEADHGTIEEEGRDSSPKDGDQSDGSPS